MASDEDLRMGRIEEAVLGPGPRSTPPELWRSAGVSEELARDLWRAMGFASIPDDEPATTGSDLEALERAARLLRSGVLGEDRLRHQTRVMSQALATVASSHAEVIGDLVGATPDLVGAASDPGGAVDRDLLGELDGLLVYIYRRHLLAALRHRLSSGDGSGRVQVVGFADLTDFTAVASTLSEAELTRVVDGFTSSAADVVASAGGRVVKLIGDEVMFTVDEPSTAAETLLGLVEAAGADGLPQVHAGAALGTVLGHHGDCFGPTVNLASRLADVARPGTVLVDPALAGALADDRRFVLRRVQLRRLKGIGSVEVAALRRGRPPAPG